MRMEIRSRCFEVSPAIRLSVGRSLRAALGRVTPAPLEVRVEVGDTNGPRGGIDKRCAMQARLPQLAPLRVEAVDADLYEAVVRAGVRLRFAVRRALGRRRSARRRRRAPQWAA